MLALIRVPLVLLAFLLISAVGFLACIFRPFHPLAIYWIAQSLSKVSYLLGVKLVIRGREHVESEKSYVIIANHQSSFDVFTVSGAVFPRVTSIGKKSLLLYPVFGLMYWLSGNILIDRKNSRKASGTLDIAAKKIKQERRSVWMFPEGTRSRKLGMLPFKLGAFRLAQKADVPILPIVASQVWNKININRWNNGYIILQILPPVVMDDSKTNAKWAEHCRTQMLEEYDRLNQEVATMESGQAKLDNPR